MPEAGARPNVPRLQQRLLNWANTLTSPLLLDDYLALINPLWSTRELRGRIERIIPETEDAATIEIRPGYEWFGHEPGQYLRIGLDIGGKRHWRAYSITSDPDREDGWVSITVKCVDDGVVSPWLVRHGREGSIVTLGGVEGIFCLPDPVPDKILMISAGSGITPLMGMLRRLDRQNAFGEIDIVHLHSAPSKDLTIFGSALRDLDRRRDGYQLHEQHTGEMGRVTPAEIEHLCPDWREREAFHCGPAEMLDAMEAHWEQEELLERFNVERFQSVIGADVAEGEGGAINFTKSGTETSCGGDTPILVAGEDAGLELEYGCREGICHTCIGKLTSGQVRDLRTGEVKGEEGETIRICIHAPEGSVEIEL